MENKGAWTLIERGNNLNKVCHELGRDPEGLALKIFYKEPILTLTYDLEKFRWGGSHGLPIYECTTVQNIAWMHGLAPRVYHIGTMMYEGSACVYQLVDYVEGKFEGSDMEKLMSVLKPYGVYLHPELKDYEGENFIDGKMVDFQIFGIDMKFYRGKVKEIIENNVFGFVYQDVEGMFDGTRNTEKRFEELNLDAFKVKKHNTVLDVGCSSGSFCFKMSDQGAKRVVGLELPHVAEACRHLANYKKYWNIDFIGTDARGLGYQEFCELTDIHKFGVVINLSTTAHMGFPEFIHKACGDLLVFEKSGGEIQEDYRKEMEEALSRFSLKRLPNSSDRDREVYWCEL